MRKSRRKASGLIVSKTGAGVAASRIGMKASETSTEGRMKSTNPDGSGMLSSAWLVMMPIICTIM